ncbi:unnamed protein product [Darwinula stevensoni]|uniref:Cadherin domain-containing protein n=1 Tax=Darwinula stevensoni TaxID=69355 RepID=A0A7R9ACY0_9CRUS|nr:unnamed protein product [Darwinula stevensoni]CAG0900253.1 unnamed protein product [Darwinula stevensoni]
MQACTLNTPSSVGVSEVAEVGFQIGRYSTSNTESVIRGDNFIHLIGTQLEGGELVVFVEGDLTDTYTEVEGTEQHLRANVKDGDDLPPIFDKESYSFEVPENFPTDWDFTSANLITISDTDYGVQFHTNEISIDQHSDVFDIQPLLCMKECTPKISLLRPLDYEEQRSYQFSIHAQGDRMSATASVTVSVTNEEDDPFVFQHPFYTVQLELNQESGVLDVLPQQITASSADPGMPNYRLQRLGSRTYFHDFETGELSLIQKLDDSITTDMIFLVEAGEGNREGSASLIVFLPGNEGTTTTENPNGGGWLGEPCQSDEDCNQEEHLACNLALQKCDCADGFQFNPDILSCEKKPGGLGDECSTDADCDVEANLECNLDLDKCDCMAGFEVDPDTFQCIEE